MVRTVVVAAIVAAVSGGLPAAQSKKETKMTAQGAFEVKLAPLALDDKTADPLLGRMSIDKTFTGDVVGTSKGEMLSARTAVPNSAGYVAIEKVTAKLGGKSGTFVLQHSSTMTKGEPKQSITVVPDSGTGELAGLTGTMTIKIENKRHFYEFVYSFAEKKN